MSEISDSWRVILKVYLLPPVPNGAEPLHDPRTAIYGATRVFMPEVTGEALCAELPAVVQKALCELTLRAERKAGLVP